MNLPLRPALENLRDSTEPDRRLGGQQSVSISETGFVTGEVPIVVTAETTDFDGFYDTARTSVIRALTVTIGSSELAIEATDEALARAVQRWGRVGALDNPAGWVYRVALNYARNRVRYLVRRRRQPLTDTHELIVDAPDAGVADPAINEALMTLSLDHRAVVVCRLLLGWSEQQTADALALRPGTVKSRLSRALSKLERRLDHLRPEDS